VAVLALELAPKRVHWVPMLREEEFPPVYPWIARQGDVRALVELPIRKNWRENVPMYYSTLHWRPIANGYSGYEPAIHRELAARLGAVPDRAGVEMLRGLGISHILIHETDLAHRVRGGLRLLDRFEQTLARGPERQVEPVWRGPAVRVYRVLPSPPSADPW
jgi:hypothetical protein